MSRDFAQTRAAFDLPEGVIYLDGNSLGPLPRTVPARIAEVVQHEWGGQLISAWNGADWITLPRRVGDRVARLIGAEAGSVVMGDTLSIKVFQALAAALDLVPDRRVILSDRGNFPSDLYIAGGLTQALGPDYSVKLVEPEEVAQALDPSIGVLMLTEVDYRTGRRHDMADLTARARSMGIITVWDLAHSAGAFPIDLAGCQADFAVGCSYKFLNGGPGAPAFIYVAPRHAERARPILSGWMGHASPFQFDLDYRPGAGIERMRVGTPPVIQLAALDTALDVWEGVDLQELRTRALALGDRFIARIEADCPELQIVTPRDPKSRGSQISLRHPEGYAIIQALAAQGVIGDFRAPDILRFGITPLYLSEGDIDQACDRLIALMRNGGWDQPQFKRHKAVT